MNPLPNAPHLGLRPKKPYPLSEGRKIVRHIAAWQAMHEHLKLSINGKKVKDAVKYLTERGYTPSASTVEGIKEAGKAYLLDLFNDDENLWPGPAKENQDKGRQFNVAKQKVDKAIKTGDRKAFEANITILEELWHDPDQTGTKIGFRVW